MKYIESDDSFLRVSMSVYEGNAIDNQSVLGKRFMIALITKGSGFAKISDHTLPFIAPCVFCINEQEPFFIEESEGIQIKAICFEPATINSLLTFENVRDLPPDALSTMYLDSDMVKSFLVRNTGYQGKYTLGAVSEKKLTQILEQIKGILIEQGANWPCRSRSYLLQMLFFLDNLFETDTFSNETRLETVNEDINAILLYLYENYEKKITVQDMTDLFHISKTTLAKMFREQLNESFLTYLNKLRISIAATMLRDTRLSISEIMNRVGFSDSAHFLRTFKKYIGSSPTAYRDEYCWV